MREALNFPEICIVIAGICLLIAILRNRYIDTYKRRK
jgi:hypothetical protein